MKRRKMAPIKRISSWRDLVAPRDNLTVVVSFVIRHGNLSRVFALSSPNLLSPPPPPSHCQPELLFLAGASGPLIHRMTDVNRNSDRGSASSRYSFCIQSITRCQTRAKWFFSMVTGSSPCPKCSSNSYAFSCRGRSPPAFVLLMLSRCSRLRRRFKSLDDESRRDVKLDVISSSSSGNDKPSAILVP